MDIRRDATSIRNCIRQLDTVATAWIAELIATVRIANIAGRTITNGMKTTTV